MIYKAYYRVFNDLDNSVQIGLSRLDIGEAIESNIVPNYSHEIDAVVPWQPHPYKVKETGSIAIPFSMSVWVRILYKDQYEQRKEELKPIIKQTIRI